MQKEKIIYALGFFDGVHLGHQALLEACRNLAVENGCTAGVVTFGVHPDGLVSGNAPKLINSTEDRCRLLHSYGMKVVFELPFDENLMRTHWSSFLTQLIDDGAAGFVCGSDFRFGSGGLGTAKKLEAFCKKQELPYAIIPQQILEDIRISSTYIRQLLTDENIENVNRFLGHPHILTGEVVPGRGLGRTIGVPTANLQLPENVILPKHGVYACKAIVGKKAYLAVTNIGSRPTVGGHHITVEPWLLDFEGDLYGQTLTLAFYQYLRPEQKFENLEALQKQIQQDAQTTIQLLK